MRLKRLRIWGVKDGHRVYIDLQGPTLVLEPEVPSIREAEDVKKAAYAYLDTVIDCWQGDWASDKAMKERIKDQVKYDGRTYTIDDMREREEDDFVRNNQGPPWMWCSVEQCIANMSADAKPSRHRSPRDTGPEDKELCRDCLQPCQWVWHECFPAPLCGSAGWVAVCQSCKTWHKERTQMMS